MIRKLLTRWATRSLQRQVAKLTAELEAERLKTKVVEAERDNLAQVVARDRERIRAEGSCYARQRAEAEGIADEQRTDQGIRRHVA